MAADFRRMPPIATGSPQTSLQMLDLPLISRRSPTDLPLISRRSPLQMLVELFNVVGLTVPPAEQPPPADDAASAAAAAAAARRAACPGGWAWQDSWRDCHGRPLSDLDHLTLQLVNAEFARSQSGGNRWRRLFPCEASVR